MNVLKYTTRAWATAIAIVSLALAAHMASAQVTIDWVTVGDPGNAADTTGYGAVAEEFRIGKYEVTIGQYAAFLNAVAQTDTYSLYNTRMASHLNIAGISRAGSSGSYTYSVIDNGGPSGNRPITYVSWFDAARFANWMHNGQLTGSAGTASTETGAYTLVGGQTSGIAPARNPGAQFYIPTENQWYKAAYYKGGGLDARYWAAATQSDIAPGNTIGSGANKANYKKSNVSGTLFYAVTQSASYSSRQNYLTDVGAFTNSQSAYGTFDQSGNVGEWNDLTGVAGSSRGCRGGGWFDDVFNLSSTRRSICDPSYEGFDFGFRLASLASPVPSLDILFNIPFGIQTQRSAGYPLLTPANATSVTKTGAGMVVFDAANTYTGPTSVQQGTLAITSTSAVASSSLINLSSGASLDVSGLGSAYTVSAGQTIAGSGTILGSVTFGAGSTLSPGLSIAMADGAMLASADSVASPQAIVVPEPAALGLVGAGVGFLGLGALRRKRA